MENHHFCSWVNPLYMAMFNSFLYVYQRVVILKSDFNSSRAAQALRPFRRNGPRGRSDGGSTEPAAQHGYGVVWSGASEE
jgi:hypothetical protein